MSVSVIVVGAAGPYRKSEVKLAWKEGGEELFYPTRMAKTYCQRREEQE
jgi:hypothetical protein